MTPALHALVAILLGATTYQQVAVVGRPDTIKLLLSPREIAVQGDTVSVLDEEQPDSLVLKRFRTDGSFIDARRYDRPKDSALFAASPYVPDSASLAPLLRLSDEGEFVLIAAARARDTLWVVYTRENGSGDATCYGIAAIDVPADTVVVDGSYLAVEDAFSVSSLRGHLTQQWPFAVPARLCVGNEHEYLLAAGFAWQYDRRTCLVRRLGQANRCFDEPSGLALTADGDLLISDYRLCSVWCYDRHSGQLTLVADSAGTGRPFSVGDIVGSSTDDLWLTALGHLQHLRQGRPELVVLDGILASEGGDVYRIAQAGPNLVLWDQTHGNRAYVCDTTGRLLREFQGDHPCFAGICGLDNAGNVILWRTTDMSSYRFWRISADARDTAPLVLADSHVSMTPAMFRLCSRVGDTLYVLGARAPGPNGVAAHAMYVFVRDTLTALVPPESFSDSLGGCFSDVVVDKHGTLWVADIADRVVRAYRPAHGTRRQ